MQTGSGPSLNKGHPSSLPQQPVDQLLEILADMVCSALAWELEHGSPTDSIPCIDLKDRPNAARESFPLVYSSEAG